MDSSETQSVHLEVNNHIAVVTLNRPPINSLVKKTYLELEKVFADIGQRQDVRVAILRSEGKFFCPGNDVSEFKKLNDGEDPVAYGKAVSAGIAAVYNCKVPVVAAVHGHAYGAGMALAAAADVMIAAEDAHFAIPEIKVGIIGAAVFLELIVPEKVVRYMSLTGNPISAGEIAHYGGVHKVVAKEQVLDEAMIVARDLLRQSPNALRYFKEAMNINQEARLEERYAVESGYTNRHIGSDEYLEAVNAFLENREPVFK
ncbi:MAG: enoyl-CoA hydratase/isomerase family protein [Candidatus Pelagadaptatus aseana]|uniref:enoyl-CoA hydratase/isomerase family protein n=1 Tax=Candidatus Pelagadaptatus aseana TaxID=3120508 RepID=UPI0039B14368